MDRRKLKETSRQSLQDAAYSIKRVTLVCLLAIAALALLEWGLSTLVQHTTSSGRYISDTVASSGRTYLLLFLVSLICQGSLILLLMGYGAFSLRLSRREAFSLDVLLFGFRIWTKVLILYFMTAALLALWSSIFAMPVSYLLSALYLSGEISMETVYLLLMLYTAIVMAVLSYRYRMAWFVLLDHPELPVRQVINQAKAINRVHRWQLFLLDISFLPWWLLGILTCGILLIWKLPYITVTYAHAYHFMLDDYAKRQARLKELLEQQGRPFTM